MWSGKLNSKIHNYLASTQDTLGAHYGYIYITGSRVVPWGWNIHLPGEMSMNHTKNKHFSHMLNPFALTWYSLRAY